MNLPSRKYPFKEKLNSKYGYITYQPKALAILTTNMNGYKLISLTKGESNFQYFPLLERTQNYIREFLDKPISSNLIKLAS